MPFVLNTSDDDREDAMLLQSSSGSNLPFAWNVDTNGEALIVHMKVLTSELKEVEALNVKLNEAVRGMRVNGKSVCVIVTDESVSLSIGDARAIAAHVTPTILKNLGLSGR